MRLYIFSSMAFFILAAILAGSAISIDTSGVADGDSERIIYFGGDNEEEPKVKSKSPGSNADPGNDVEAALDDAININGKPWDKENNPVIIPLLPLALATSSAALLSFVLL